MFVFPADLEEGEEFFGETWPEARAVSDPDGRLFEGMKVSRASLREIFGPGVWVRAVQAWRKGFRARFPVGNPWLLPGMFLVRETEILWKWRFRSIGDHPDLSGILLMMEAAESALE